MRINLFTYFYIVFICVNFIASSIVAQEKSTIDINVDPRTELISIVCRLAGYTEYNQGKAKSYSQDVENYFGNFKDHPTIQYTSRLEKTLGIGYADPMRLALCLNDNLEYDTRIPFTFLGKRWKKEEAYNFIEKVKQFSIDSDFTKFFVSHKNLYKKLESDYSNSLKIEKKWFDTFFSSKPNTSFKIILCLLIGNNNYGPSIQIDGKYKYYSLLGVRGFVWTGFLKNNDTRIVVHELCHSYINPLVDKHESQLEKSSELIFTNVQHKMKRLAYSNWKIMIYESLVRASVIHYFDDTGTNEFQKYMLKKYHQKKGFIWIPELYNLIKEFKQNRDIYPTFDSFMPKIVIFFKTYSDNLDRNKASNIEYGMIFRLTIMIFFIVCCFYIYYGLREKGSIILNCGINHIIYRLFFVLILFCSFIPISFVFLFNQLKFLFFPIPFGVFFYILFISISDKMKKQLASNNEDIISIRKSVNNARRIGYIGLYYVLLLWCIPIITSFIF